MTARPTPFFLRRDGQLRRAVDVSVVLDRRRPSDVTLRAEAAGQIGRGLPSSSFPLFGSITEEVGVPDSAGADGREAHRDVGRPREDGHRPRPAAAEVAGVRGPQLAHRHRLYRHPAQLRRAALPEHRHGDGPVRSAFPTSAGTWKSPGRRRTTSIRGAASGWTTSTATPGRGRSASRPCSATSSPGSARPKRLAA